METVTKQIKRPAFVCPTCGGGYLERTTESGWIYFKPCPEALIAHEPADWECLSCGARKEQGLR